MVDYNELRKILIRGLEGATGEVVVRADAVGDLPTYPFTEIKNTLIDDELAPSAQYMKGTKRVFEDDIELTYSINSYSDKYTEALELVQKAKHFFKATGIVALQDVNIAVVETTTITDRTSFLVNEYQHRFGFDVRIRVRSRVEVSVDYIERVNLQQK